MQKVEINLNNQPNHETWLLARPFREDGDSRTRKSSTQHPLNNTKNKAKRIIPFPSVKLVMIIMNTAIEGVYKKVFVNSYQHDAPLNRGA